jgi:flavin reductase (DIM6/NTAB) family NADH-FMN oxidoreductase RutF
LFYTPRLGDHGLRFDPFKAIVAPRPIGWISSLDAQGRVNLAPYSFFNAISTRPHIVMFGSEGRKHSIANIEATGEFVCSLATWELREAVNATSAPFAEGVSEFDAVGLEPAPSYVVKPPRVAKAVAALECRLIKTDAIPGLDGKPSGAIVAFGEVVGIHVDEACIRDGRFDMTAARSIARCGYMDYAVVESLFQMQRPPGGD